MIRDPPLSPLFPYTTLFRSQVAAAEQVLRLGREEPDRGLRVDRRAAATIDDRQPAQALIGGGENLADRKSTRLNSSHRCISYAVFCLKKKKTAPQTSAPNRT